MFLAQYEVLRERGHSPSEAFNETVEEATQSLYPLIAANGMDWMYAACSTTARRGAIDWSGRFKDTLKPVFNDLYDSVKTGKETKRSLEFNSQPDYRDKYEQEMKEIRELEIWRAGKAVRSVLSFPFSLYLSLLKPHRSPFSQATPSRKPDLEPSFACPRIISCIFFSFFLWEYVPHVCMIDTKMARAEYVYLSQGKKKFVIVVLESKLLPPLVSYLAPKTPIPSNLENDQTAYP